MTNKDIVLHSLDPYLLMRMFTDLQMDGRFEEEIWWNKNWNPFISNYHKKLKIYFCKQNKPMLFLSSNNDYDGKLISLTEENYLSTLKMILE